MKRTRRQRAGVEAFTLAEVMIALTVGGVILGGMVVGFGTFQRVFAATDEYYKATGDQMRVLDSIASDMRSATSGTVSNSGRTLTLNLLDYLDQSQNPPAARTAIIAATGAVTYGPSPAPPISGPSPTPPRAAYSITGISPNETITRTYTPTSGSASTILLTSTSATYQFSCYNPANPGSTNSFAFGGVGEPFAITAKVSFIPKFNRLSQVNARTGTVASTTVVLRNHSR